MKIPEPVLKLRDALERLDGARLKQVILYDSYIPNAREAATNDSDIDVAVDPDGIE